MVQTSSGLWPNNQSPAIERQPGVSKRNSAWSAEAKQ